MLRPAIASLALVWSLSAQEVEGIVRNAVNGQPLSKARIALFKKGRDNRSYLSDSDNNGKFTLRELELGDYSISVDRLGYVSSSRSGRRAVSPSSSLTLTAGQSVKNIEIRLIPHAVLTGHIYDADGDPVPYATVHLLRYRYNDMGNRELTPINMHRTNDLGEYRLFGLAPGKYFLGAAAEMTGETTVPTYYPGTPDPDRAEPIVVAMGATVRGVDLRALTARTFEVSGHVAGIPDGATTGRVTLLPKTDRPNDDSPTLRETRGAVVQAGGRFTIRGVLPGSYALISDAYVESTWLRGTSDVEVSRSVDDAEVTLQPVFNVPVTVRLEGEPPADPAGISVFLGGHLRDGRAQVNPGRAASDGKLTVRNVASGVYDVMVSSLPENHYVKSIRVGAKEVPAAGLKIVPGAQIEILIGTNGGKLSGKVVTGANEPEQAALVALVPTDRPLRNRSRVSVSDQQGRFAFSGLTPGDYYLAALAENDTAEYLAPDFVKKNEKLIEKISIREGINEAKTLTAIPSSN